MIAVDAEPAGLARLRARKDLPAGAKLETRLARFETLDPLPAVDLVNASFCLFSCSREDFLAFWDRLRASLAAGGRFSGQLLGPRDTWAVRDRAPAFSREEIAALCEGFSQEMDEEVEEDSTTPRGEAKHWHFHHLVLRRLGPSSLSFPA